MGTTPAGRARLWSLVFIAAATGWVLSFVLLVVLLVVMGFPTGLPRVVERTDLDGSSAYSAHVYDPAGQERFRTELAPVVAGLTAREDSVLAILTWVMTQVSKVENRHDKSSWRMVEFGRAGQGLICGGMSQILKDALLAHNIPARRVSLQRNLLDPYDTHVSVEAWVDGKWRLYDPTFHLAMVANGERVGVLAARDWFLRGAGPKVELEFLGEVPYPARVEHYYIRFEALLNNVYINLRRDLGPISELPGLGPWLSNELAYPSNAPDLSPRGIRVYQRLYTGSTVILPLVNLVLLLSLWALRRFRPTASVNPSAGRAEFPQRPPQAESNRESGRRGTS